MNDQTIELEINVNGTSYKDHIASDISLLDYLRRHRYLTGTKKGCGAGECGSCTVLLDGLAVYSCILPAVLAHGKRVETIEALGNEERIHPIQQAFIDAGAVQCGYCTPGMIMSAKALLTRNPAPRADEIKAALAGNICRCTGYRQIIEAVETAARSMNKKDAAGTRGDNEYRTC